MGTFATMLVPYFKFCESFDYSNEPIGLSFQSRNVVEFSSPYAARTFCFKKSLYMAYSIYILFVRSLLVMIIISCFRKSVFFSFDYFKELLNLELLSSKIGVRLICVV